MNYTLTEKDWSEMVQPWAAAFLDEYQNCMLLSWDDEMDYHKGLMDTKSNRADKIDDMQFWLQQNLPGGSFAIEGERRIVTCFFFKQREHMMLFKLAFA